MHEVIIGGARAYLDLTADPEMVRKAIEEVDVGEHLCFLAGCFQD
jgi:hypothetical protein